MRTIYKQMTVHLYLNGGIKSERMCVGNISQRGGVDKYLPCL